MQEEHVSQEVWDKKKIFITAIVLGVILGVGIYSLKDSFLIKRSASIKGIAVEKDDLSEKTQEKRFTFPTADDVKVEFERKIEEIRKEVETINVVDIASSSPQVQKIIRDLQALEQYPKNQAKEICENICKSL